MNTELSSKYDPSAVEALARQVWMEEKCFHADPSAPGESYCIVIPPPNVTGALHLGHAINNTLQDILTRMHRMMGFNTLWIPGIDHAGIATQAVVEKQLKEQENKTRHDVGREGLVERIWKWKEQYGNRILEQLQRLGCSCDWDRTRFTLDDMCASAVRETFFKLFKDGLIYRGKRLVNWDTFLQTSISDDEIYHETVKTFLWHIRYPIEDSGESAGGINGDKSLPVTQFAEASPLPASTHPAQVWDVRDIAENIVARPTHMIVATTRPETMLGDTAVAVHSEDARWNWAIGKHVRLPLTGRLIPIIADDILVDPKFGTGVVKVTPAHDPNDYAVWQRHKGQADEIDLINILTPDGKITTDRPEWSQYAGMKRDAARKKVVEDLKSAGLLEKEEPYETQVGHSDRSKTPVEPYLSDQWFVKMAPLAEPALEAVREGKIKFHPERHAQQYLSWLGEKRDWPVSRQLWWGHRIPVWTKHFADQKLYWGAPGSAQDELNDWLGLLGSERIVGVAFVHDDDLDRQFHNSYPTKGGFTVFVSTAANIVPSLTAKQVEIVKLMESAGFVQDPDVLDTWFSSALWPHSTLGWPEQTAELSKYYPTSVLLTGRDIITLWVARMVMMGMYNMGQTGGVGSAVRTDSPVDGTRADRPGKPLVRTADLTNAEPADDAGRRLEARALGLPFLDVVINPTILDGKGERMSKSKGNGVDPVEIIDSYGADALRFTLTKMATETQDARMPVKRDASGKNTSEKFDEGRNFCNKLWNACRFALTNLESVAGITKAGAPAIDESRWSLVDRWILARFHRTVDECNQAIKAYRFDVYAKSCYDFFWRDFCDWYVEAIKPAMKDQTRAAQTAEVLAAVLDGSLRLMHPMIPFITETVWWRLNEVRPQRGLPARLECPSSKRLVQAQWPTVSLTNDDAQTLFPKLQELISSIRTIRNDYQVSPKTPVAVSIKSAAEMILPIDQNRELIEMLATCTLVVVTADLKPVENTVSASAAGCDIYVAGLIDPNAEKLKMAREIETKKKLVESMKARLSNEAYLAKAPPHLVKQTQDQLSAAETELVKLEDAIRKLKSEA